MHLTTKARTLVAGAALVGSLGGMAAMAAPAGASNWNIPNNIHYPFFPECNTHMSVTGNGFGTQSCKGEYTVNKSNYMFTQDNTNVCPAYGTLEHITLDYVLNPASGGVTTTKTLAGFSMHW